MAEIGLYEAMRTLRAVRRLRPDVIPDDVLRRVLEAATWAPTGGNDIGVPVPQQADRKDGAFWSGSPYLGYKTPGKSTATSFNECGEYYNVTHSHALFQVTNYGASGGGMLTMVRIDPPGGC